MWILIVIALNGSVSFQEFDNRRACKHAEAFFIGQVTAVTCVAKTLAPGAVPE